MHEPYFKKGDSVLVRSTLEQCHIESDPQLEGGEYWYRVRIQKQVIKNFVEDDLESLGDLDDSRERMMSLVSMSKVAFVVAVEIGDKRDQSRIAVDDDGFACVQTETAIHQYSRASQAG